MIVPTETISALIKFRVHGNLRFLSHIETINVFQRACVRAQLKNAYSKGFNPRPKMSLPLPRSVALETDDDLLCLQIEKPIGDENPCETIKSALEKQLPNGIELISVTIAKTKKTPQPVQADYRIEVEPDFFNQSLKTKSEKLMASETITLKRPIGNKGKIRTIDVRGFIESIEHKDKAIVVKCKISPAGSIRVDEIISMLDLDNEKLAAPVKRTNVQWLST
ncbi:TIGR03936 family radical SAM-associated protein [Planctomycetota bacterium]